MVLSQHTRLLTIPAAVACALLMLAATGIATAQEETTAEDPLSRYDSPSTAALAEEYEQNQQRAEEIEDEIEALEDAGEWGDRRSDLRDELADLGDETDMANALGNARLSDIEAAPLPLEAEAKAVELRKKAASLGALTAWAASAPININSRLYGLLGAGEAAQLARTYRAEAGALEVAINSEEAAREEAAKPEPEPEPEENPDAGAGGENLEPVEDPEAAPDEGDSGGSLDGLGNAVSGFSLTSLLAAALIAVGVGYYLIGLLREGLGARVKGIGSPQQARAPKSRKPSRGKTGSNPKGKPETSRPETQRDGERAPEKPEREFQKRSPQRSQEKTRQKTTSEPEDGSALVNRLQRMREQGPSADDVETPTAEELSDMFDREDDGEEGR